MGRISFTTFTLFGTSGTISGVFLFFRIATSSAFLHRGGTYGGNKFYVSKSFAGGVSSGGVTSLPFYFLVLVRFSCLITGGIGISFQTGLVAFCWTPEVVCSLTGPIGGGIYLVASSIVGVGDIDSDETVLVLETEMMIL